MTVGKGSARPKVGKAHGKIRMSAMERKKKDLKSAFSMGVIRKLARKGGVKRLGYGIYEEARSCIEQFLQQVIKDSIVYAENSKRVTIMTTDIMNAMKKNGRPIYLPYN